MYYSQYTIFVYYTKFVLFAYYTKYSILYTITWASLVAQMVKNLRTMWESRVQCLAPLEKGMATHSNILAWRIPWTEGPGQL